jgi:alpha-glucosidase
VILALTCVLRAQVRWVKYQAGGNYLIVEVLDDDLIHFEMASGAGPAANQLLRTSAMVSKTDYGGPTSFTDHGGGRIETAELRVETDTNTLFVTVFDKLKNNALLATFRPLNLNQHWKGLIATRTAASDFYGLGQQFLQPGNSDLDWDGRVREGGDFGNVMASFNEGANGNTQIPILYAVNGASFENYALFLDNIYKQRWDFTSNSQWKVEMFGDQVRFYILSGPDLADLRKDYMELVGRPLVPPKKVFGLWISEFGYDNWAELESKLASLRTNKFPVDGFFLDVQWFGGVSANSDDTRMGSLSWDSAKFPNPASRLQQLKNNEGIGIINIEEAYIGRARPEHGDLHSRGCLAKACAGCPDPAYLTANPWWGKGGLLDYSSDGCGDHWHDAKRQALINDGLIGHWTDLGEPEMFDPGSGYADGAHADAHNLFNLKWLRSIHRGYARNNVQRRPFMISRSGAAGIQRFGAGMWSGDISSRLSSLATHAANQAHMSFSGIDYYDADIGGFHRNLEGGLNEMYVQWYAYGMLFDIPARTHVENLCNCKETAPDRIGDIPSNLENTRMRYELIPYLYSLAHRAHRFGEPLMPPPILYYQTDANARSMGHEKLIGRDLLAALVARHGEQERDVYLPAGTWIDYYSLQRIQSIGQWIPKVPVQRDGRFRPPLYAREGAIIPLMFVDDKTQNALGKRSDNSRRDELIVKVFPSQTASEFTLFEDDGETTAYQRGEVRATRIAQKRNGQQVAVAVDGASGTYSGAPASRNNVVRLIVEQPATAVSLNGAPLTRHNTVALFESAVSGWINAGNRTVLAKSGVLAAGNPKDFVFTLEQPQPCASALHAVSVPGSGNGWNPADPARTLSCAGGGVWRGRVSLTQEQYKFAANGAWTVNWGCDGAQNGPNCPPRGDAPGVYEVTFDESKPASPGFLRIGDLPPAGVSTNFACDNGHTSFGASVYVLGNIAELGGWNASGAIKLDPNGPYPRWTGTLANLPGNTRVEWKCVKRLESGGAILEWQPGGNNVFVTPASGSAGVQRGGF